MNKFAIFYKNRFIAIYSAATAEIAMKECAMNYELEWEDGDLEAINLEEENAMRPMQQPS